jgi:hypothetical protein
MNLKKSSFKKFEEDSPLAIKENFEVKIFSCRVVRRAVLPRKKF